MGIDKDTWHRYRNERAWFYEVTTQGYRYHMSNINAAIGIAQFKKFESFIHRKKEIVQKYNNAFMNIDGIKILSWNLKETAPFTYIVRVLNGDREDLIAFLKEKDVGTGIQSPTICNHFSSLSQRHCLLQNKLAKRYSRFRYTMI